ncbi:TPA: flagella biosynthesis regulatory protein FliZ [Providencia alcalifaciens]|uniref:flagella biosynthesis regulatory protein FliZ n=1 Tax=Providencia alcalifaciens TaxID=126385 RepID=UPI003D2A05FA
MLDGVAIHKEDISHLSQRLSEEEWHVLQTTRLKALCRFCRELYTPPLPVFFDFVGFQQYLLVDLSMKPSTVREYVLRLRRIDTLLVTLNIDMPRLNVALIKVILAEHYSKQSFNNAGPALNQYADYVTECLVYDMAAEKACFNARR